MDASGKDVLSATFSEAQLQEVTVVFQTTPGRTVAWLLWRYTVTASNNTNINRSHYEDILITSGYKWCAMMKRLKSDESYQFDFEQLLTTHNNTHILKFIFIFPPNNRKDWTKECTIRQNVEIQWERFEEAVIWDSYENVMKIASRIAIPCPGILYPQIRTGIRNT